MAKQTNSLLLKQQQKLSAAQIQLMQLIQLPALALEQRIKEELEINPVLEDDATEEESLDEMTDKQENEDINNIDEYLQDDDVAAYKVHKEERNETNLFVSYQDFQDDLKFQLDMQNLTPKEQLIGNEIIGNLDYAGYLVRSLEAIADDILFRHNIEINKEDAEKVLHIIQGFDPAGIAARNLNECLMLQLNRINGLKNANNKFDEENHICSHTLTLAKKILEKYFSLFTNKRYQNIISKLECSEEELQAAINLITSLNPKPANTQLELADRITIIPDYVLWIHNGKIMFSLTKFNSHNLRLSSFYQNMFADLVKNKTKSNKETIKFIKTKMDSAKIFMDALERREDTLTKTMQAIIDFQYEYFINGDVTKMKPMKLADIADIVNLDISTISRVVNDKYVQTHFGIFKLKEFFSYSITNAQGEEIATEKVRAILLESIQNENKLNPLTDEQLCVILKAKGYPIARRTVAKYREVMNIPVARLRKEVL
ncbi:MAG: RNA polymerase factor sigma-54 [Bacteroidales bacterium]|jgi:RNA polymerase sigma-54 factor|nr:RNA polymerase factor sigma-54 [Bacteroidales bacterium]